MMSESIQAVKLAKTEVDEVDGPARYIRSDMARAMAAVRRDDGAAWSSEASGHMGKAGE